MASSHTRILERRVGKAWALVTWVVDYSPNPKLPPSWQAEIGTGLQHLPEARCFERGAGEGIRMHRLRAVGSP